LRERASPPKKAVLAWGGASEALVTNALSAHLAAPEMVTLVAHWLSLWLGLYLLSRRPRSAALSLAGLSFVAISAYLLCDALLLVPASMEAAIAAGKWLGGLVSFAPAFLLHAYLRLGG